MMRNTIYLDVGDSDQDLIATLVADAVTKVRKLRPGLPADHAAAGIGWPRNRDRRGVEGAHQDNLPPYAGNLDIMTSAALRVAELHAEASR